MANNANGQPKQYYGVTISSTFDDLKEHRAALIRQIDAHDLKSVGMEHSGASVMSIIESSLQFVRDGAAYIGIISKKYGQVPESTEENPNNLSITELEFDEALRQNRPILLFIMSDDHLVRKKDVESDPEKIKKLEAFTARAMQMGNGSKVHRVYAEFESVDDFVIKASSSLEDLKSHLENGVNDNLKKRKRFPSRSRTHKEAYLPQPPAFYAVTPYIGSHKFVGRRAEMDTIDDWARPADSDSILLFEAIGGNGKSMLTWEWVTNRAKAVREDWAGVLWYSFYEKGAVMADFCRQALCYMTGRPINDFKKMKTVELRAHLLPWLNAKPWLLILDGLERVLVAYNRIDAADVADEDMDDPDDAIVDRDPCACINTEDDELLRLLAGARPSKILISSRLPPKALINNSNQHIQGVRPVKLQGLRPIDAEGLFRNCDVTGDSKTIQEYLTANCGNHPLTIGVLAGLINNYLPDRSNFDSWNQDDEGGGQLNFAELDLVQRRNHILAVAMHALPEKERQLLGTLALLSEAVDYSTLLALNPHLSLELRQIWKHEMPYDDWPADIRGGYERQLDEWNVFREELQQTAIYKEAVSNLWGTVQDLEKRGLLQYDRKSKRYDLHPVVRHVASGGLTDAEKQRLGQQVVDFFTDQAQNAYEQTETLADVSTGVTLVRTLLQMGSYKQACKAYAGGLNHAIVFNLEANHLALALLRPFFSKGWGSLPPVLDNSDGMLLAALAAVSLDNIGRYNTAEGLYRLNIINDCNSRMTFRLSIILQNISMAARDQNQRAVHIRIAKLALQVAELSRDKTPIFTSMLNIFDSLNRIGKQNEAAAVWKQLAPMGRSWNRAVYRSGDAECHYAWYHFWAGSLLEIHLSNAERLARKGKNRIVIRDMFYLRGYWNLNNGNLEAAIANLVEAVRLARDAGIDFPDAETRLAFARYQAGEINADEAVGIAEQLGGHKGALQGVLAELWLALGNNREAQNQAIAYYEWAWADGEPYVNRYDLNKATELLKRLNMELPMLAPYDETKIKGYSWEKQVERLIKQ